MTQPGAPQELAPEVGEDHLRVRESGSEAIAGPDGAWEGDESPPGSSVGQPRPARAGAWPPSLTSTAAVPGPAGLWYAEVPDRILAFVLDVIALAVVGLFLAIIIGGLFGGLTSGGATAGGSLDAAQGELNVGAFVVVGIVAMAISFAYFAYSWVVLRSTPGMRMLGLRIGHQRDGRPITWDQALIRWLLLGIAATFLTFAVYVPSLVGLVLAVLGVLWLLIVLATMGRSPTKQGLHDRYARTILVRAVRRAA